MSMDTLFCARPWVCGRNGADPLAYFGLECTIDGLCETMLPIEAKQRQILADRRLPNYGLHGVQPVTICGISGMRDAMLAVLRKSAVVVVCHSFQHTLDVVPIQAN